MEKISCKVYQDILPLYVDDVVSDETREFVADHLQKCLSCRAEFAKMKGTIELPLENSTKPLESIKREWAKKNTMIWGFSLLLISVFLMLALPIFDTAMQYHVQELVGGSIQDLIIFVLPLTLLGFGMEWWFVHFKKCKWITFLPLIIPAAVLFWAELAWAADGWNRFGAGILCTIGFPLLLGSSFAALLKATLSQPKWAKITAACVILVFIILSVMDN